MESEPTVVVRVMSGQVVIACPHNNCGGVVKIPVRRLISSFIAGRKERVKCEKGIGLSHEVEIGVVSIEFLRLSVKEI